MSEQYCDDAPARNVVGHGTPPVATSSRTEPSGRGTPSPCARSIISPPSTAITSELSACDDSATLPHLSILAAEIVEDLRAVLAQLQEIADDLTTDEAPA